MSGRSLPKNTLANSTLSEDQRIESPTVSHPVMSGTPAPNPSLSSEAWQEIASLIHETLRSLNLGATPPPPPPTPPPPPQPPYTPPLTGNPAAGASPSLLSLFPKVEVATVMAIIMHDFRASDL